MLLTGEAISANRAREIGLVNRAIAPEALDAEVESLARLIASKSPAAIATGKQVFYRELELPLDEAYAFAGHAIAGDFVGATGRKASRLSWADARRGGRRGSRSISREGPRAIGAAWRRRLIIEPARTAQNLPSGLVSLVDRSA